MKKQLIIEQLEEVRRQSLRVWAALPEEHFHWRPDPEAMSMLEVVRHVLKADAWFQFIIDKRAVSYTHLTLPTICSV